MIGLEDKLWKEKNRLEFIRIQELENRQLPLLNKYKDCKYIVRKHDGRAKEIQFYKIKDWELETNSIFGEGEGWSLYNDHGRIQINYNDETFVSIRDVDTDFTIISEERFNLYLIKWTILKDYSNQILNEFINE